MARHDGEPLDHWHARAATTSWWLVTQAAADHDDQQPKTSEVDLHETFADWYAAGKAVLNENFKPLRIAPLICNEPSRSCRTIGLVRTA